MRPLAVGFDLDMTLLDTRPGIAATYDALSAQTGVVIDSAAAAGRLGPPLVHELANWFAAEQVEQARDWYRAIYPATAVAAAPLLPGAREAVTAVRAHGGAAIVVSGKFTAHVQLHLDHLDLQVDAVYGDRWAHDKAVPLLDHGVTVYVGDHAGDVQAAHAAGAVAVAVVTGHMSAQELRAAGADVVLDDLTAFPAWLDEHVLDRRLDALHEHLSTVDGLLVAFSGGADSAFLLAAAVRAVGYDRVIAATAVSPSLPAAELAQASRFAAELGVRHLTPRTNELARDGYRSNGADRCYFCKAELLDVVTPLAAEHGLAAVATGTNADDLVAGFRPGIRAAAERGAITPLADAGLTKAQVRAASRRWSLVTADKPAAACLSSRVAYGLSITRGRLARVERAEVALRSALVEAGLPVTNLRVRDMGVHARVEVDADLVAELSRRADLLAVVDDFDEVVVDPKGFRSGSMNELLKEAD